MFFCQNCCERRKLIDPLRLHGIRPGNALQALERQGGSDI
jgi:hypothetical protein